MRQRLPATFGIVQLWQRQIPQGAQNAPELVLRVGIVLLQLQRSHTGKAAQHQRLGALISHRSQSLPANWLRNIGLDSAIFGHEEIVAQLPSTCAVQRYSKQ